MQKVRSWRDDHPGVIIFKALRHVHKVEFNSVVTRRPRVGITVDDIE